MRCRRKPRRNLRWAGPSVLLLSSILQAKHTGRRRGKLFTKSNEEAWQNRSDTTKAAMPPAVNRQGNERISRPAIRKAADPLRLHCICITAPFLARNPRQLPLPSASDRASYHSQGRSRCHRSEPYRAIPAFPRFAVPQSY